MTQHGQSPIDGVPARGLIGYFVAHPVAANLLMLVMVVTGVIGLLRLNAQSLPTFPLDFIVVQTEWPGATAEDVEQSITFPLEQELHNLDNLKEMRSTSAMGLSYISLEFKSDTEMGPALDQVTDFVSQVRDLPANARSPNIRKFLLEDEVATVVVSSRGGFEETRQLAYQFKRELLDRGISKVEFIGVPEREIAIQVEAAQLGQLKLSLNDLGRSIRARSQDIPAGIAGRDVAGRDLRSIEQRRKPQDFEELPVISNEQGGLLHVGDIATVEKRPRRGQPLVFKDGFAAIEMRLLRPASADALKMAEIVDDWLREARANLPPSVELSVYNQAWQVIEERISLLLENGFAGLVLVLAVLYIFLNGRVAFWVAAGIPIAFLGTLFLLYLFGGSINMVTLFAMVTALGIIVDDAIVVGEDAYTHHQRGESPAIAAEWSARRMLIPVLSSSTTTIAAFLPLLFISGMIGEIMFAIPLVIICVVLASLLESFLILPYHLKTGLQKQSLPSPFKQDFDAAFAAFRDGRFRNMARWALENRLLTLCLAVALLVFSLGLVLGGRVPFTFFSAPPESAISANAKFSASIPPAEVVAFAAEMESALWRANAELKEEYELDDDLVTLSLVRHNMASFGFARGQLFSTGEQYAMVQAELVSPDAREVDNQLFIERWREQMASLPGLELLTVKEAREGPPGRDLELFLTDGDSAALKAAVDELADTLASYPGVYNIGDNLPWGREQMIYRLTPLGLSLGLDISTIGSQLHAAFEGMVLQVFYEDQDEVEVKIVLPDAERNRSTALEQFPIVTASGAVVPLGNVVDFRTRKGTELLRHTQGKLGVRLTADVDTSRTNANAVLQSLLAEAIPRVSASHGVEVHFKGRAQEQAETAADMITGAVLGLTLIYITLALVFSSYSWPLAVMCAIPFGISGAILGHWLLGMDLMLLSLFGFFGLSGIVINDSIILISFYKQLRENGASVEEAIIDAACQRLRAVLLTSLTTIAGLTPLIFDGSNQAQFLKPMAVSIAFGLAFATVLVLIIVPVLLSYIETTDLSPFAKKLRHIWRGPLKSTEDQPESSGRTHPES